MANHIYQFKVTLLNVEPSVWRRILVPDNYSFWDLHVAIQDSMGWTDSHLHLFRMRRKHSRKIIEIGIPNDEAFDDEPDILPGWDTMVSEYFYDLGNKAEYLYDFGDSWLHEILLEGHLLKKTSLKYPLCLDGSRACPPEDCGGESGYFHLLEVISNPHHEEHEEMLEWIGKPFNPSEFDPKQVKFDNPKKRWKNAFAKE